MVLEKLSDDIKKILVLEDYIMDIYYPFFIYAIVSFVVVLLLMFISYCLSYKKVIFEKISAYECGFEPYEDGKAVFNVSFFLVGILFLIFDLEIIYILPWVVKAGSLGYQAFYNMLFFLFLLVIGFIYEWCEGALDW